jgi:ATP-binding cassette subfamily B protein
MMHGGGWHTFLRSTDEKPKVTWVLLKRVLGYSAPYRWQLIGMLFFILINSGLHLLTPLIIRDLIDHTIPAQDVQRLIILSITLLLIPAMTGAINVIQRRLNTGVGEGVIYDLRVALFSKLQRMSLRFFTHTRVGEMMSRLNNDVIGAQNAISSTIVSIITNIIQALAVLMVIITMEWRLTLISIMILPLFIIAARVLGERLRKVARDQMQANAQMNAMMNETLNIGGALLVKLFGREETEVSRFEDRAAKVRDLGVRRAVYGSFFFVIIGLLSAVGTALVYGLGGYMVIIGTFTVGTIVAFGSYMGMLYSSLQGLANAPVEFSTSVVSFERVFEVIDLPMDIQPRANAVHLQNAAGKLEFRHVWFMYDDQTKPLLSDVTRYGQMSDVTAVLSGTQVVESEEERTEEHKERTITLEDINFRAQPGQLTALVGPSGAGKTTITYLIPRLYDPVKGRILIDRHDLRDITLESLSSLIGMVTQETYLFHDTIRTNLLYANLNATQVELEQAATAANIHDFIMGLPDQYDTIVGERGYRLSGGEKQRIALARVILKNPRILVLDEATSSLDSESEALIQDALKRVMMGRTNIVIAHRLSTILAADQILVIDHGKIIEQGTHTELLKLNGMYKKLYTTQFHRQQVITEPLTE